jgi:transposase
VTLVVMEATSWKAPQDLLEAEVTCWLVNARKVNNVPGRPTTDRQDAILLAKVAEWGMCRRELRTAQADPAAPGPDRYRRTLVRERTREA